MKPMEGLFDWGGLGASKWQYSPYLNTIGKIQGHNILIKCWNAVWWKIMTGTSITLNWPNHSTNLIADPDEVWRPWLENNVGYQHIDWEWRIRDTDDIEIIFRKGLELLATQAKLTLE